MVNRIINNMKNMKDVTKEYLLEFVISVFVGGLGALISILWPEDTAKHFVEVSAFSIFFLLSFLILQQLKVARNLLKFESTKKDVSMIYSCLKMVQDAPKAVHNVMIRYSKRFFGDLCSEKRPIYVRNYVHLLEESLGEANKKLLATSLITPEKWLDDNEYKNYFVLQEEKKIAFPEMEFSRIFILKKEAFQAQATAFNDLAKNHIMVGIKIGYCYEENLIPDDVRDLVQFKANDETWVIDAGRIPDIPSTDKKTLIEAQFQYTTNYLNNQFDHWIRRIEKNVRYVNRKSLPISFE